MVALFCIGRRWPDGRVGIVVERAGEHVDPAHWQVVKGERARRADAEREAAHRQYADEERRAMYGRRDVDEHGNLDVLEQDRV